MDRLDQSNPWYVYYSGRMRGPISRLDTLRLASDGKLGPSDLVWTVGYPEWIVARDVQGLYKPPPLPPGLPSSGPEKAPSAKSNGGSLFNKDAKPEPAAFTDSKPQTAKPYKPMTAKVADPSASDAKPGDNLKSPPRPSSELRPAPARTREKAETKSETTEKAADEKDKPVASESKEPTNDVREVLEALLSESDGNETDHKESEDAKRKDGLLDQIVKRIRDSESSSVRAVVSPAKPETGKIPTT